MKTVIFCAITLLPATALAGKIGNNVVLSTEYAETNFVQDNPTVHPETGKMIPASPGHWERDESDCSTHQGSIAFLNDGNKNSQTVNVSFGGESAIAPTANLSEDVMYPSSVSCSRDLFFPREEHDPTQKQVHFETSDKRQAFRRLLEGNQSVQIRFVAKDCSQKGGPSGAKTCSSLVESADSAEQPYLSSQYSADNIEVAFAGDKKFNSLRTYLAEVAPTKSEEIANQLSELTQKAKSAESDLKAHANNLIKELEPTTAQAAANDFATVYVGGAK